MITEHQSGEKEGTRRRWRAGALLFLLAIGPLAAEPSLPEQIDALMEERRWEEVVPLARRWIVALSADVEKARRGGAAQDEKETRHQLARARHVLGSVLERAGEAVAAAEVFKAAWAEYEMAGAGREERAACADEAGRAAQAAGQWQEAERWLRLAVSLHAEAGPSRALARVQLAEALTRGGQPGAAADQLEAAAAEAGSEPAAHWAIARMRGVLSHTMGQYAEALTFFSVARQLADSVPGANVMALRAALDAQAGQALFRLGRHEEAGEALVAAEAWFRRQPDELGTWSACVNNLAAFWLATGQSSLARKRLVEILAHASSGSIGRVWQPTALLVPWLNLAAAELAEGQRTEAEVALNEAEARATALPEIHPLRAQIALLRFALNRGEATVGTAAVLAAAREASSQARAWLERMATFGGGEEQWLEFRRTLDPVSPLAALASEHEDAVEPLAEMVLATQGLVLEQRLQSPSTESRRPPETLSWQDTVAALPPESVLVNFVWWRPLDARGQWSQAGRYGALILAQGRRPRWRDLGSAEDIDARVRRVIAAARDTVAANAATRRHASLDFQLESLWKLVWGPIAPEVAGVRRLLLRPDGMLHFVPWAILRAPAASESAPRVSPTYFCQRYDDVTLLARPRPLPKLDKTSPLWRVLAVSEAPGKDVPPPPTATTWPVSRELWQDLCAMPALPGVSAEVSAIRSAAGEGVRVEVPLAAQAAFAMRPAPSVLHFCGHGFAREQEAVAGVSLQAGLVLADCAAALRGRAAGQVVPIERDGLLFVHEAAALPLTGVSLVALSGCQTGLGHWQPGEHLEGLRHAFIVAGARHVAATLWDVNDAEVPEFVGTFYQRLAQGVIPSVALWSAQRAWLGAEAKEEQAVRAALAGAWTLEAAGW